MRCSSDQPLSALVISLCILSLDAMVDEGSKKAGPFSAELKLGFTPKLYESVSTEQATEHLEAAHEAGIKKPNYFNVKDDEVMMLPEVLSKLKTDHFDQDFADGDDAKELELRGQTWWGRLYIEGWPQPLQYFRAHFGEAPPMGMHPLLLADPIDACTPPINGILMKKLNAIVLTKRGNCTFSTKARILAEASAASMIVVNNEPGNTHVPGPDAHGLEFPAAMITRDDGKLVERAINDGQLLMGAQVPIHCVSESKIATNEYCRPLVEEERELITKISHGGWIKFHAEDTAAASRREFLLGMFGIKVPPYEFEVATAEPRDACTNMTNGPELEGKAVLVYRGGCEFFDKVKSVFDANPAMVIIVNNDAHLIRPGVEPRWEGLKYDVPIIMVTDSAGSELASTRRPVSFSVSNQVNSAVWDSLYEARDIDTHSDTSAMDQLRLEHTGWPDRLAAIDKAFGSAKSTTGSRQEL